MPPAYNMGVAYPGPAHRLDLAAELDPARLQSPTLLHSAERWGQAHPASDFVPVPQSLTVFIFDILNMFIYTNSYSIAKFTFNHTLWHYVKKVLNFLVDELMYEGESSTSRLIFWLGMSGLIASCLYSHVIYDIM
jgi:hypothetical protein